MDVTWWLICLRFLFDRNRRQINHHVTSIGWDVVMTFIGPATNKCTYNIERSWDAVIVFKVLRPICHYNIKSVGQDIVMTFMGLRTLNTITASKGDAGNIIMSNYFNYMADLKLQIPSFPILCHNDIYSPEDQ